jgi:tellurite resistance protein
MGLGKILLGATIGVGAVAAAPFTGGGSVLAGASLASSLAGAGTIAAATGAGALGATSGAVFNDMEEEERYEERKRSKSKGFEDGIKKGSAQTQKKMNKILNDVKSRDQFLIALTAFSYAVANCDGRISEEELDELDYYLNYIKTNSNLSAALKGKLTRIKNRKAGFKEIRKELDKLNVKSLKIFDEVLENVISADNIESIEEKKFRETWIKYYDKRKN